MEQVGTDRARFTTHQKLIILDVPDEKLEGLLAGLDELGLPANPSAWRRNLMACTGLEFCKLSFVETRVRAQSLVPELEQRLDDLNAVLTCRSRSTSTVARTRALVSRWPTSGSRAR